MLHTRLLALILLILIVIVTAVGCSPAADAPAFDKDRAFGLLERQVAIGPRFPGSPGHVKTAEFIRSELTPYVDGVRTQEFSRKINGKSLLMRNIIAWVNPDAGKWVILAAHWDTRPTADMEVIPGKRKTPIAGANDGASGVAVILELARLFSIKRPDVGVLFVFFDGEDYGPSGDNMFLGSRFFAENLDDSLRVNGKRIDIAYGILLDMIGDADLVIHQEENSVKHAPEVVEKVWKTAERIGHKDKFISGVKHSINDDHIPLIKAGIKCIDVIDFDYAPWHTLDDTPDKCSPDSLKVVGEVIAKVVYNERQ